VSEAAVLEVLAGAPRPRCSISRHFPPVVREALVAASLTETTFDPLARVKAINRAAEKARALYPDLFKKD
jgi:hypothetical protein